MEKIKIFQTQARSHHRHHVCEAEEELNSMFMEWQEKEKPNIIDRKFSAPCNSGHVDFFLMIIYK